MTIDCSVVELIITTSDYKRGNEHLVFHTKTYSSQYSSICSILILHLCVCVGNERDATEATSAWIVWIKGYIVEC